MRAAGKLEELTHEMDRYRWNILGLCEIRRKNFGETTEEGHEVFFGGKEDKQEHDVGILVHKGIVNTGCQLREEELRCSARTPTHSANHTLTRTRGLTSSSHGRSHTHNLLRLAR